MHVAFLCTYIPRAAVRVGQVRVGDALARRRAAHGRAPGVRDVVGAGEAALDARVAGADARLLPLGTHGVRQGRVGVPALAGVV